MIVSRKNKYETWRNLEGASSRLSGLCFGKAYLVNFSWHRLYGRSLDSKWDLNNKPFDAFKEVDL